MKKTQKKFALFAIFILISLFAQPLFAQNGQNAQSSQNSNQGSQVESPDKFYMTFDYGLTASYITRIVKQEARSNFVYQTLLAGAEVSAFTHNLKPFDYAARLSAFYPLSLTFNDVEQSSVALIQGGIDLFMGINFPFSFHDYVILDVMPGLHTLFQVDDRFTYLNCGLECALKAELPIAYYWTIVLGASFSYDYGNLGTNKQMEVYDYVYQYQGELAFRFTKKHANKTNYIGQSEESMKQKEEAKIAAKQAKKAEKEKAKAQKDAIKQAAKQNGQQSQTSNQQ